MKIIFYVFISVAIIFLISFCSTSTSYETEDEIADLIYSNSFESLKDVINWKGHIELKSDTPRNGGKKSIRVLGGCIIPHTYYLFQPIGENCSLIIRFWGKNLMTGGSVNLSDIKNSFREISVSVEDKSWKKYISSDTLVCHSLDTLMLSFNSGGVKPSAMLIDNIEIIKVNK